MRRRDWLIARASAHCTSCGENKNATVALGNNYHHGRAALWASAPYYIVGGAVVVHRCVELWQLTVAARASQERSSAPQHPGNPSIVFNCASAQCRWTWIAMQDAQVRARYNVRGASMNHDRECDALAPHNVKTMRWFIVIEPVRCGGMRYMFYTLCKSYTSWCEMDDQS